VQGSNPTEARIALVRHARSSHVHTGWIDASGFQAWRDAYEAAGIHEDERVPAGLAELAGRADLVLSSDAARAIATARLLAPGKEIVVSPLLRELDLEGPALGAIRLPLLGWAVAVGFRTLFLTLRRQYPSPAEAKRIKDAAAWLEELAVRHSLIVAVTHASFRRRLSDRLVQTGWKAEPGRRTLQHWSAWLFSRNDLRMHAPGKLPLIVQQPSSPSDVKAEAEGLRLGLIAGLVDVDAVVAWADRLILDDQADGAPVLFDLSLSGGRKVADVISMLREIPGAAHPAAVGRRMAADLAAGLADGSFGIVRAARVMYLIMREGFAPDAEFESEAYWADDGVDLALEGVYCTLEEVGQRMTQFLARYRQGSAPWQDPNHGQARSQE
jgi:broad specificity phosphatase PhoE